IEGLRAARDRAQVILEPVLTTRAGRHVQPVARAVHACRRPRALDLLGGGVLALDAPAQIVEAGLVEVPDDQEPPEEVVRSGARGGRPIVLREVLAAGPRVVLEAIGPPIEDRRGSRVPNVPDVLEEDPDREVSVPVTVEVTGVEAGPAEPRVGLGTGR